MWLDRENQTMFYRLAGFCFALTLMLAAAPVSAAPVGDETPAWLQQAAAASAPVYKKDVPGVSLHQEETVTVGVDGRVTTVTNYAVRVLTREGRALAAAVMNYDEGTDKVREMRAWLIRPNGTVKKYGKDETVDRITESYDLYNELRERFIVGVDDAEVGAVFGYTVTTEQRPYFPQAGWAFQGRLPVLVSRFSMTLPAGWRAASITFNSAKVEPVVNGATYTWEMRNLPPVEFEPASPSVARLVPQLAVNYMPAAGEAVPGGRTFETWANVSKWYSELADPQAAPDDALALKARELTANAKTELEKIQAIGRFVQNLQYVSIQIGIGGYRPHSAAAVFAKKYGDCKDKATLMRAMLRVVKIDSYAVLIYSGDRTFVREDWASPTLFNHCIVAVRIGDATNAPSVVAHPTLGRLLIFDATDDVTPVGDLPWHEQGSLALIAAGDAGALLRMPAIDPEASRTERQADVALSSDGSIRATLKERSEGQTAARERGAFRGLSRPDYTKMIELWITKGVSGASVSKIEPSDSSAEGRFALDVEFTAPAYAQQMQSLLIFKPALVSRREFLYLTAADRKHPVVLESGAYSETVRVKIPAGFAVDEMPDPLKIEESFGNYAATYEVKDDQLVFTRIFVQRATTIPADKYSSVRRFYERIRALEQSPVVLARK